MDILKKHYEKFLLGFLLLSFVIALIYLLDIMGSTHDTNSYSNATNRNKLVIERENKEYDFGYTKEVFSLEKGGVSWELRSGEGLIGFGRPGLAVPMKALRCQICHKILPWALLRKNELRCPFEACSQDLRDPGEPEDYEKRLANFDADGDGMPDRYEIRLGLNPNSAEDADQDKDGDKFSNWFEYYCGTNPDNEESSPSLEKMIFLTRLEAVKLPIKLNRITAVNPKNKNTYNIFLTINHHDSTMKLGAMFFLNGVRYRIADAEKRDKTQQGTSSALMADDSTIWIIPVNSKNPSDRIEVRSNQDVYDRKTLKATVRDIRTPKKRRSNLVIGKSFTIKSIGKDKKNITFTVSDTTEKDITLKYTVNNKPQKLILELVDRKSALYERFSKAYVKEDSNKNYSETKEAPSLPTQRSRRRR